MRLVARAESLLESLPPDRPARRSVATDPLNGAWSALSDDAALSFATAFRDPVVATRVLADRGGHSPAVTVTVQRTTLLRHKAGRRGLLSFDVRSGAEQETWLGKVRARGTDLRSATIHQRLWAAGARCIPEPLGVVHAARMTLQRAVPGVPLLQALEQGASPTVLGAMVAHTLHAFHSLTVEPDRHWSLDNELTVLRRCSEELRTRVPTQSAQLERLYGALMDVADPLRYRSTRTLIHRDFYHDQVLVDGCVCTLVDLDLVATGDPGIDLGNFVAHLIELQWRGCLDVATADACLTSFAESSIELSPRVVSHDVIARYTLLSLGRLLEIASRHPDRAPFVPRIVELLKRGVSQFSQRTELATLTEVYSWHAA